MVQPDPLNDPDTFTCQPSETIHIITVVDKAPLLALLPRSPTGGTWSVAVQDLLHLTDTRVFLCPSTAGNSLFFDLACDEDIAAGDPNPIARYRITLSSLTNTGGPIVIATINVPQGSGPVARTFTFNV